MDVQWTTENIEGKARIALGAELNAAADLFPRVVVATYVQMSNEGGSQGAEINSQMFRQRVRDTLPSNVAEVLPFFVRAVWNQKWTFQHNRRDIEQLASRYVNLLAAAGKSISTKELIRACADSFSGT